MEAITQQLAVINDSIKGNTDSLKQLTDKCGKQDAIIASLVDSVAVIEAQLGDNERSHDSAHPLDSSSKFGGRGSYPPTRKPGPTVDQNSEKYVWLGRDGPTGFVEKFDSFSMKDCATADATSAAELNRSYTQIKEGLQKVKLPEELHVGASNKGIKSDCQAAYSVVSNTAGYTETAAKWVAEKLCNVQGGVLTISEDEVLELFTIVYAQTTYLKGEYSSMLAQGFTDPETAKVFKTLERNPGLFSERSLKHLSTAADIVALKTKNQQKQWQPKPKSSGGYQHNSQYKHQNSGFQSSYKFGAKTFNRKRPGQDSQDGDSASKQPNE